MRLKSAILIIFAMCLAGCETLQSAFSPIERKVVDNALYSSKYPKGVININKDYQYIGMVPESEYAQYSNGPGGSVQNVSAFLFTSKDAQDFLNSFVSVNFWSTNEGYWIPGFDRNSNIKVGKYIKDGFRFDTAIYTNHVSRDSKQAIFLEDNGHLLPSCTINKTYQQIFSSGHMAKNKLTISYGEAIECADLMSFLPENRDTKKSIEFIENFSARADKNFRVIGF